MNAQTREHAIALAAAIFAAGYDPREAKRKLAEGQAIENAGRHLRGFRQ